VLRNGSAHEPVDERLALARRIVSSPPFHRAEKLRALLLFLVEEEIAGRAAQLTEQQIGIRVFQKPADYSPVADSSVRANARLLRLRLHEYYANYGQAEPLLLELPKGGYAPLFRPAASDSASEPAPTSWWRRLALPASALALTLAAGYFWGARTSSPTVEWPLAEVLSPSARTQIVVSDINYQLLSILSNSTVNLDEYIGLDYPGSLQPKDQSPQVQRLTNHLSRTTFVSYADMILATRFVHQLGGNPDRVWLRSARDVKIRDLDDGNLILVGSPASNLWTSLFDDKLNFVEQKTGGRKSHILNRHPLPGEAPNYVGIRLTGTSGEDYAALALIAGPSGRGSVIILQGLQQEGTEAAGRILTTAEGRQRLRAALHLPASGSPGKVHFEVLLRSRAVGGTTAAPEIVATRRLP